MALSVQDAALPRLVLAAPASGHGKTTVATGLMAALTSSGMEVSGHKVGPDYIDPSYHALATGRAGRNLDPHLQGTERIVPLLRHGAARPRPAEIAVVEGVMGLFDGALGTEGFASTAHVARLTASPVVLVVDASAAARSVAALVHGFATFDPGVHVAGVILNKVGSPRHEAELRASLDSIGMPVLGALHRSDAVSAPSRHLGLVPVHERHRESGHLLDALRAWIADGVDLEALVRVARTAGALTEPEWDPAAALGTGAVPTGPTPTTPSGPRPVVAAAAGAAFTFRYAENVELLEAAGVDVVDIDPTHDEVLPDGCSGLYFGGGFPEVHAAPLAENAPLRRAVAHAAGRMPVVAECAGLTYLCRELDGQPMAGVLDASARMTERRTLGYRTATAAGDNVLAATGDDVTGHEFHRTRVTPDAGPAPAWLLAAGPGRGDGDAAATGTPEGFAGPLLHASYLHVHWAGRTSLPARFAAAARRAQHAT
ncbi:cobyrinic acid a,c-diamide synthase [Haloactinopolyspora alba]|uniref:Hydrogenobyrinate a,c-diamide synthase n=1 Tax=Haloactinopolyspora alba TaxID=648780 RepID=A0A2P8EGC6_9ACTN|nr:cobyrinate a,c-diamide synthase [Haloactinopolyspora alba]PSL08526.1 cobyrinic acid a,c-diamide synthase [Haloactinopolyspora alba]